MPRIAKHLLAGFIGLAYLAATLIFKTNEILSAQPDLYPNLADLLLPRPILIAYAVAPACIAIAIYHLYCFTMSGRDPLTGTFTAQSLWALRACGLCLSAGGILFMGFETILAHLMGAQPLPFNSGTGLPFMFIGGALVAISRDGGLLASNAKKMRRDLDQIV